jgi:hypothetical protein
MNFIVNILSVVKILLYLKVRKFLLYGFLALLSYQFVGFFTFVELEHYFIRKEIKKAIKLSVPENQLIKFHFTAKESQKLNWVKPHEFRLNGRFYDVVHKQKVNGIWYFQCIDDRQETALFDKIDFATADNLVNSSDQHPVHGWLKLMNEPMEPIQAFESTFKGFDENNSQVQKLYLNLYLSRAHSVSAPPPEMTV